MSDSPLISIILPAFNVEKFIEEAILSVLNQSYENWELLIVDNNSTDGTARVISQFKDPRIKNLIEKRQGVGHARNMALKHIQGAFFCFFDGDDVLPENSLKSRLKVFQDDLNLSFVDGRVEYVDENLRPLDKCYVPKFRGFPFKQLLKLNEACLFGNTWMIKNESGMSYRFQTDMTHAEDLFFYLTISQDKKYSFTTDTILLYRQRSGSAMRSLDGLQQGYELLLSKASIHFPDENRFFLKWRIIRIMVLSWIFDGKSLLKAIGSFINLIKY